MNVKFYNAISKMKNSENAAIIESIKNLYVVCEGIENPVASSAFLESAGEYLAKQKDVLPGTSISQAKGVAAFDLPNGKARITIANFENAIIEVSPLAEAQFFPVGTTKLSDGIGKSYKVAVESLNDNAMMEGLMSNLIKKAAPYALAGAAAIGATGCAGQFNYDDLLNKQADGTQKEWTPEEYDQLFSHLGVTPQRSDDGKITVTSNDISNIVMQMTDEAKGATQDRANSDDNTSDGQLNNLSSISAFQVANILRDKIANNEIKVVSSYGENPNIQANAISTLDRGFDHVRKQQSAEGTTFN